MRACGRRRATRYLQSSNRRPAPAQEQEVGKRFTVRGAWVASPGGLISCRSPTVSSRPKSSWHPVALLKWLPCSCRSDGTWHGTKKAAVPSLDVKVLIKLFCLQDLSCAGPPGSGDESQSALRLEPHVVGPREPERHFEVCMNRVTAAAAAFAPFAVRSLRSTDRDESPRDRCHLVETSVSFGVTVATLCSGPTGDGQRKQSIDGLGG
jgi:hypothetical protein